MVFLMWILSFIVPISLLAGMFTVLFMFSGSDYFNFESIEMWQWIVSLVLSVIGFIIGLIGWDEYKSPSDYWRNSNVELFHSRLSISFKIGLGLFMLIPNCCCLMALLGF